MNAYFRTMVNATWSWLQREKYPLLLGFAVLLAFWPLSTFLYIPKWDNIDCYLPYRHFVGYALHHGEWPLWNPFQHFGYPAYSDLQNGMYNPVVFLLQCFGPYHTTSLILELLFYVLVGAFGAYSCAKLVVKTNSARFLMGLTYGLSGFMLGTTQIMIFIAGAAFLPLIIYHFVQWLQTKHVQYALCFVLFLALHLTTASPAYSIVLFYLLVALLLFFIVQRLRNGVRWVVLLDWKSGIVVLVLFIAMVLPLLIAVYEFLPYFGRAEKLTYSKFLLQNPFDYRSYVSFVFPYTTLSGSAWFDGTDLTMRSAYFGLLPLLFMMSTIGAIKQKNIRVLWLGLVVFLVLCAGGTTPIYRWVYSLPGFGLFRHPSLFRAHVLLIACALAAIGFEQWGKGENIILTKRIAISGFVLLLGSIVFVFTTFHPHELVPLLRQVTQITKTDVFSIRAWLLLNAIVGSILIGCFIFLRKKQAASLPLILGLILFDLLMYSHFTGPYTVYFPYKNKEYVQYIKQLPTTANPSDATKPYRALIENYSPKKEGIWRNTATLHKRLTFDGHNQTQFKHFNELEHNGKMDWAKENSLFYSAHLKGSLTIRPNSLWHSERSSDLTTEWSNRCALTQPYIGINQFFVAISNSAPRPGLIVLSQNYHHLWRASWNGKSIPIRRVNNAFMGVTIPSKAKGKLVYTFDSSTLRYAVAISILGYITWLCWYLFERRRMLISSKRNTHA
jgi:hypothetical protein